MNPFDSVFAAPFPSGETDAFRESQSEFQSESQSAPLLIFQVGETLFALPALVVSEIHALPLLAPLPETAPFILGLFDLRGEIVPVLDLNARFGNASPRLELENKLIVLRFDGAPVAILADEVCAVTHILAAQIGAPPAHGRQSGLAAPFVAGVTRIDDEIVLLLHLPHLLDFGRDKPDFKSEFQLNSGFESGLKSGLGAGESRVWTVAEREILQERALRLRSIAVSDTRSGDFDSEAAPSEKRAPVAIFTLGGEEFAASLDTVREFASVTAVASVPCCPPHILGQINLRGDIVTLVDVREPLRTARTTPPFFASLPGAPPQKPVPVVVVEHEGAAVGIAVDEVRDVLYLRPEDWTALDADSDATRSSELRGAEKRPSESGRRFFARGAIYQGRLLPLLDIARLLGEGGLEVDQNV